MLEKEQPSEEVLAARAYLSAVAEPPASALAGFVEAHGVCRASELVRRGDVPALVADEVEARREHVSGAEVLSAARFAGIRLVTPEHPEWPHERFAGLTDATAIGLPGMAAPLALWVRGSVPLAEALETSVSIVGARAATGYGERLAVEFGHGLASAGFTVVSGAAYGIDGAAHRGALATSRPTVAFLACGADIDYPAGHSRLLRAISEQGVVVSEYPPGASPRKHRFLVRNRLIAASGQGTVVVEAGARSGASNTANTADALGRPVMAVPGPVTSKASVGCHEMVRGAKALLVTGVGQILETLSPLGTIPFEEARVPGLETDSLDPHARQLYDALVPGEEVSADQLAQESGLPLRKIRALLPALELAGLAMRNEQGWSRCA
ncbi:DNA-processing protein DprA [Saccharopolyspora taberi]|uniref:DNA-processing protein DprA n=1 Tax=Saccharopolyspora taberi TaxID=60895 RepID=A0ABN3V5Y6_9PSEU